MYLEDELFTRCSLLVALYLLLVTFHSLHFSLLFIRHTYSLLVTFYSLFLFISFYYLLISFWKLSDVKNLNIS